MNLRNLIATSLAAGLLAACGKADEMPPPAAEPSAAAAPQAPAPDSAAPAASEPAPVAQAAAEPPAQSPASSPTDSAAAESAANSAAAASPTPPAAPAASAEAGSASAGGDIVKGWKTWRSAACERCHGAAQEGMVGPSLIESLKKLSKDEVRTVVLEGRIALGMPGHPYLADKFDDLYAYLKGRSDGSVPKVRPDGA